jgi:hypothetical protein
MDTRGSLRRIVVVFAIAAGFYFPAVSHQFAIHGDSDKSGNALGFYGGRKEAVRTGK